MPTGQAHRTLCLFQIDWPVKRQSDSDCAAEMPEPAGCVNCTSAVPTPGSEPTVIPGSICSSIGQCDVLPIGLDSSTVYSFGSSVPLNVQSGGGGTYGPGNWGSLALGGSGGSNERTNIADGYGGPLAINQWVTTQPGFKSGPWTRASPIASRRAKAMIPAELTLIILLTIPALSSYPWLPETVPTARARSGLWPLPRFGSFRKARGPSRPISSSRKPSTARALWAFQTTAPAEDRY